MTDGKGSEDIINFQQSDNYNKVILREIFTDYSALWITRGDENGSQMSFHDWAYWEEQSFVISSNEKDISCSDGEAIAYYL